MIISLGIVTRRSYLAGIELAVALLTLQAIAINRAAGIDCPLWGDTVNTASRMESSGSPGDIQMTREVADRLKGQFDLTRRGLIQMKGKGEMETFLLNGELGATKAVRQAG